MMNELFAAISLSFSDPSTIDRQNLLNGMERLGLTHALSSTEGDPVILPEFCFGGSFSSEDRMDTHRQLHRGLNAALKRLGLHGRFFIHISPDANWSCCYF